MYALYSIANAYDLCPMVLLSVGICCLQVITGNEAQLEKIPVPCE